MVSKKPARDTAARRRLSLASRLLGGAVRATVQAPPAEEPWRNIRPGGNNKGKRPR